MIRGLVRGSGLDGESAGSVLDPSDNGRLRRLGRLPIEQFERAAQRLEQRDLLTLARFASPPHVLVHYVIAALHHLLLSISLANDTTSGLLHVPSWALLRLDVLTRIGKSVFMAYAFQRYSREHPDATVIMASYNNESELKRLVIAQGGEEIERAVDDSSATKRLLAKSVANADSSTIVLLDGPPKNALRSVKWVAFCSPNERWFRRFQKNFTVTSVYMPLWTPAELREAAEELNRTDLLRPVDAHELALYGQTATEDMSQRVPSVIEYRFAIFGGVARACLASDLRLLKSKVFDALMVKAGSVKADNLLAALQAKTVPQRSHSLLHYVPDVPDDIESFRIRIGSEAIDLVIAQRIQELTDDKLWEFEAAVQYIPEMGAVLGFCLGVRVCRMLERGCTIEAVRLGVANPDSFTMKVEDSQGIGSITNAVEITPFHRTQRQVALPMSKTFESIDAFYWVPDAPSVRVVLFQVTASMKQPVKSLRFIQVLEAQGLWERVRLAPAQHVCLVFVVPKANVPGFRVQPVLTKSQLYADSVVSDIPGIGPKGAAKLRAIRAERVQDCYRVATGESEVPLTPEDRELVDRAVRLVDAAADDSDEARVLEEIPQYVWGV